MARQNSNIPEVHENLGNRFTKPAKLNGISEGPTLVSLTHIFFVPTHPPTRGSKTSLVYFKHKVTTSANYTDGIGTGYMSHDKELCLHFFKINQSNSDQY